LFSRFLLFCGSCFSAFPLFSFFCFSAFLHYCFSCFSVLFACPASLLFCFSDFLASLLHASLLFRLLLFLLLSFFVASAPFYFYFLSFSAVMSFCCSTFSCFSASFLYPVSLLFFFVCLIFSGLTLENPRLINPEGHPSKKP
jgi:hypothetical protein